MGRTGAQGQKKMLLSFAEQLFLCVSNGVRTPRKHSVVARIRAALRVSTQQPQHRRLSGTPGLRQQGELLLFPI
jgi:hypothetical protein